MWNAHLIIMEQHLQALISMSIETIDNSEQRIALGKSLQRLKIRLEDTKLK